MVRDAVSSLPPPCSRARSHRRRETRSAISIRNSGDQDFPSVCVRASSQNEAIYIYKKLHGLAFSFSRSLRPFLFIFAPFLSLLSPIPSIFLEGASSLREAQKQNAKSKVALQVGALSLLPHMLGVSLSGCIITVMGASVTTSIVPLINTFSLSGLNNPPSLLFHRPVSSLFIFIRHGPASMLLCQRRTPACVCSDRLLDVPKPRFVCLCAFVSASISSRCYYLISYGFTPRRCSAKFLPRRCVFPQRGLWHYQLRDFAFERCCRRGGNARSRSHPGAVGRDFFFHLFFFIVHSLQLPPLHLLQHRFSFTSRRESYLDFRERKHSKTT